jgi:tetratricopeptide (TPR) repeat protein
LTHFQAAASQPVDYIFPHRLKTVDVLKTALQHNPGDGKAYYYIGNILYDKQPAYAIENWEHAIQHEPELAIAYRNLGWGYYRHYGDGERAISFYEKAISLNKQEAIYYAELDALYEMRNTPIETRLKLFDGNNDVVIKRDDAFIRQIEVLTLAGHPDKAVGFLDGIELAYREGTSRAREIIIDAQLMMGKKHFQEGRYEKALNYFLEAQVPEEEAGSVRSGNRDLQVNYYIGLAYEALGKQSEARSFFRLASGQELRRNTGYMAYYMGLSHLKLGNSSKAKEVFESMIAEANQQLESSTFSETGVIFGEREAENTRRSRSYTMRGLGYKGLGQMDQATTDLKQAVELSYSNLWAKTELDQ